MPIIIKRHVRSVIAGLFAIFLATSFQGCKVTAKLHDDKALVRVLQSSPTISPVDVKINDQKIIANAEWKSFAGYQRIDAGRKSIRINDASSGNTLATNTYDFGREQSHTLIVSNRLSNLEPLIFVDDTSAPLTGQTKLRFVHAALNVDLFDIYITPFGADIVTATPRFTSLAFKSASATLQLNAGAYQVRATKAGTKVVIFDSDRRELVAGESYLLVAVELLSVLPEINGVMSVIGISANAATPRFEWFDRRAQLRISTDKNSLLHADTVVDLYADDKLIYRNLQMSSTETMVNLPIGAYRLYAIDTNHHVLLFDLAVQVVSGRNYKLDTTVSAIGSRVFKIVDDPVMTD
ncbi:MAG: DUF4397 domain-containing protein [Gammaproteobacteria bacterium]|nr:DUF4397 domain-containing protein [Gammaproteobacteria bacterium]